MKAFPQKAPKDLNKPADNYTNPLERGMDLRDYFAVRAMQALIEKGGIPTPNELATIAYKYADSMMMVCNGIDFPVKAAKIADPVLNAIETEIEEAPKPAKKVAKKNGTN
jgi:hypothetical protein